MKVEKSLLQRVQSRISLRRNEISKVETAVQTYYSAKASFGFCTIPCSDLKLLKSKIRAGADSQKLDKQIYQMLLSIEREKYAQHSRSAYRAMAYVRLDECAQ